MKTKLQKLIAKTKWYYINSDITEEHFPIPKKIETKNPQIIYLDKNTTSQECLDLIKSKGMRPANIYELLEWKNNTKNIKREKYYIAFDSQWKNTDGDHRVPCVYANSDGVFMFDLSYFEADWDWDDSVALLCFCDSALKIKPLKETKSLDSLTLKNFLLDLKKVIEKYE